MRKKATKSPTAASATTYYNISRHRQNHLASLHMTIGIHGLSKIDAGISKSLLAEHDGTGATHPEEKQCQHAYQKRLDIHIYTYLYYIYDTRYFRPLDRGRVPSFR